MGRLVGQYFVNQRIQCSPAVCLGAENNVALCAEANLAGVVRSGHCTDIARIIVAGRHGTAYAVTFGLGNGTSQHYRWRLLDGKGTHTQQDHYPKHTLFHSGSSLPQTVAACYGTCVLQIIYAGIQPGAYWLLHIFHSVHFPLVCPAKPRPACYANDFVVLRVASAAIPGGAIALGNVDAVGALAIGGAGNF